LSIPLNRQGERTVRLFESVLIRVQTPKQPQRKFLCHLMRLMLMLPGRMTFRNLSRDSPYHEKTFARWFARDMDFVSLNHAAIVDVVPHSHEHVLAFDPSFVPNSGKHTYGLDMFWNGAHSRAEPGLEIAPLAWIAVTHNSAYTLSVEQTSPAPQSGTEETRIDTYVAHIARVVTPQPLPALKYLAVDGYVSNKKCVDGVCALDLHVIGTLRRDANLRRLSSGPRGAGPGRPKTYDGKVDVGTLAHFEQLDAGDADLTLYSQVVNYYKARFQIEFLFRDAKQFTGLSDCQARSADKLRFHLNASLSAVSFAKLEARQSSDTPQAPFSMASLKRRYFNQHLIDRILDHLATEGRLEKCSTVYEELCNDGTIDDMAA
jgi:DDE superfamily endonuclease